MKIGENSPVSLFSAPTSIFVTSVVRDRKIVGICCKHPHPRDYVKLTSKSFENYGFHLSVLDPFYTQSEAYF